MSNRPLVAVVDYGAGNLVSIHQALTSVGADVRIAADRAGLVGTDAVVVPGVGAAAPAMVRLERQGLVDPIAAWLAADRPFLGICLGLQLLFEGSDEDEAVTFGTLPGRTVRLVDAPTLPHIGWNQVERSRAHPIFDGIDDGADFYFVHSYAGAPPDRGATSAVPADADELVLARTTHGRPFVSAVARGSMVGVQFHPERSGTDGLRLLANFVDLVRAA
ncbi:MAG: imidazole glycerol phosphate synthase subunit HisH [Chloroflexota bacterium]